MDALVRLKWPSSGFSFSYICSLIDEPGRRTPSGPQPVIESDHHYTIVDQNPVMSGISFSRHIVHDREESNALFRDIAVARLVGGQLSCVAVEI